MKPLRINLVGSLLFVSIASLFVGGAHSAEKPEAGPQPLKLTGIFDPYECRDSSVTNAVVMKAQPKCGECHAWAVLTPSAQSSRLELWVAHGRTTNSWVFTGRSQDGRIVFEKPKFHLIYSDGCLKGEHKGRMNAHIELKPAKP